MLALAFLLLHAAPPQPPPAIDRYDAAQRLWEAHFLSAPAQQAAIDNAISHIVRAALTQSRVHVGNRRWQEKYDLLAGRLHSRVPAQRAAIDAGVTRCAAHILGHRLAAEDLDAARRFMATPEGARIRAALQIGDDVLQHCYRESVSNLVGLRGEDYQAARLRPPRFRYGVVS